jgi:septal ring factor EnvC (AmiA/AmiB activator)
VESSTPTEPQPPAPPPTPAAEDRVATRGELRSLRRWLIVAGIWAVAATAIGVIAFVEARDAKDDSTSRATQADIDRVRDRLREDIDELGTRVDGLPTQSEVSQLESRIRKAQRDTTKATDDAADGKADANRALRRLDDLEPRVETLENASDDTSDGN